MPRKPYKLDKVAIRMVKEPPLYSDKPMNDPESAIELMRDVLKEYDREVLCIVNLKANLVPINLNICSMGIVDGSVAHPREILKSAILSNAASVILMHNHPSGNLNPSKEDIALTDRMQQIFKLMGIGIVDHVILADGDRYFSFREHGYMNIGEPHYTREISEVNLKEAFPIRRESIYAQIEEGKKELAGRVPKQSRRTAKTQEER